MKKIFNPEENLMKQMSRLNSKNASKWYKEYLKFHNGVDQGVDYLIGYFSDKKKGMLKKQFGI